MDRISRRDFIRKSSLTAIAAGTSIEGLSQIIGAGPDETKKLIDYSCRLSLWKSLINLDFHFINVDVQNNYLIARYSQLESYMIVRLPQQHIAEQFYNTSCVDPSKGECVFGDKAPDVDWCAQTRISGYSYLVFRIVFGTKNRVTIQLKEEDLLDWNNEKKYRLVVRQNLQESLFNLRVRYNATTQEYFENTYPLGYENKDEKLLYNPTHYPKAYGDPITAIEAPWRLIISPRLPNQDKYKFNWEITSNDEESSEHELWMATLTVIPRPEAELQGAELATVGDEKAESKTIDEIFRDLDILFIGSPDHPREVTNTMFLPEGLHRQQLVDLYIKYKLLARANKLTFSGLGISTFISFKNYKINELFKEINLYTYKHLISFGRDEEVEVSRVILEKETGLKMLLIQTTKRRTKEGVSFLDYREYIMPLELEKDYQNHTDDETRSKFNAPFKKIRFLETDPKRICPLSNRVYDSTTANLVPDSKGVLQGVFYPLQSNAQGVPSMLTFELEITDWHDQKHKFKKSIQAITVGIDKRIPDMDAPVLNPGQPRNPEEITLKEIEEFFSPKTDDFEAAWRKINETYRAAIRSIQDPNNQIDARHLVIEQANDLKTTCLGGVETLKEKLSTNLRAFDNAFIVGQQRIDRLIDNFKLQFFAEVGVNIRIELNAINTNYRIIQDKIRVARAKVATSFSDAEVQFRDLRTATTKAVIGLRNSVRIYRNKLSSALYASITAHLGTLNDIANEIRKIENALSGADRVNFFLNQAPAIIEGIEKIFTDEKNGLLKDLKDAQIELAAFIPPIDQNFEPLFNTIYNRSGVANTLHTTLLNAYRQLVKEIAEAEAEAENLETAIRDVARRLEEKQAKATKEFYEGVSKFKGKCLAILKDSDTLKEDIKNIENASLIKVLEDANLKAKYNSLKTALDKLTEHFTRESVQTFTNQLEVLKSEIINDFLNKTYGYLELFKTVISDPDLIYNRIISVVKQIDDGFASKALIVKNIIFTYRSKIGYAVNQLEDEVNDFINDELSALETDFIVLQGAMKTIQVEKKIVPDFFHQYASIPQLKYASVYIPSVCKLVNEEFAVGISYAQDYFRNQVDLVKLEIEKNKSRIFAEIKESSRSFIQGKIRNISSELGGIINPELPTGFLTYLQDPKKIVKELIDDPEIKETLDQINGEIALAKQELDKAKQDIENLVGLANEEIAKRQEQFKSKLTEYKNALKKIPNDLVLLGQQAKDQWNEIKSFNPETYFKDLEAKVLGAVPLKDILGIDFELPRLSPARDAITYNFVTSKIKSKDFSFFRFGADKGTKLQIYLNKNLRDKTYQSFIKLNNFNVAVKISSEDVLLVKFSEFDIKSSDKAAKKVSVKIHSVAFGGPLDFFAKLAEKVKMPGSGLRINPSFRDLEIGYSFPIPSITSPAFNFSNIKFDVALRITYADSSSVKPLLLEVGINRPADKFLITVGIFGGRGHFTLSASPERLEKIDAAIEYGGYIGINLGIASGYVFLFAGVRMIYKSSGDLTLVGYIICEGGVTVFGFISIYLTVELAMTYRRINNQAALYGSAYLRYSVKIGFFKMSFGIGFTKQITGAKGKTISEEEGQAAILDLQPTVYYASAADSALQDYELVEDDTLIDEEQQQALEESNQFKNVFSYQEWKNYAGSFSLNNN